MTNKLYYHIKRSSLAAVLFLLLIIPPLQSASAADAPTRIITDMRGGRVAVPDPLERVALFGGPTGQISYILGARSHVCAVSKAMRFSAFLGEFDPSMKKVPAPRGTNGHINLESLLISNAQLVIAGTLDGSIVEKKTAIPVAYLEGDMSGGFDLLKKEIRFYADVFQRKEKGEAYIRYLDRITAMVQSRVKDIPEDKRKKVFHGYGPAHLVTLGGDTFMNQRIQIAGCLNASAAISTRGKKEGLHMGLDEVSMESLLGWNPDILVIDTGAPEALFSDPKWMPIRAVKNRQVFIQPIGVFIWDRPTAESAVLHPLWLAKIAYPERFKDIDMAGEVIGFYKKIMGFDLTEAQAKKVLSGGYKVKFGRAGSH